MIIVPVSGGKDSTLCLLKALNTDDEVLPVYYDTGWEHPEVEKYLLYLERKLDIKIERIKHPKHNNILDLVKRYNKWPSGTVRFCTRELKQENFRIWIKSNDIVHRSDVKIWLGMRIEESVKRKTSYSWLRQTDEISLTELLGYPKYCSKLMCRLPILHLTARKVFSELKHYGIMRNELYNIGFNRVGCFPCFLSTKNEQEKCLKTDFGKEQLVRINDLADEIGVPFTYGEYTGKCMICDM